MSNGPHLAFAVALAAAVVPGLCVLGPLALYLSASWGEESDQATRALSWLACAELVAAAVVLAINVLG